MTLDEILDLVEQINNRWERNYFRFAVMEAYKDGQRSMELRSSFKDKVREALEKENQQN